MTSIAPSLMDAVPRPPGRADRSRLTRSMQPETSLVGREVELARLSSMLGSGAGRLVTVTGPGGVGKTRLASAVVASWTNVAMPAIVVELAPVRAHDLVMPTIALSFGLQVGTNDPVDSIVAMVGEGQYMLVLDNLEHVLDIAPAIADLIARCPGLVVLATSRAPLRIRAEQAFPLGPLSLPQGRRGVDDIEESAAARMFAERARAVSPTFAVDASNADADRLDLRSPRRSAAGDGAGRRSHPLSESGPVARPAGSSGHDVELARRSRSPPDTDGHTRLELRTAHRRRAAIAERGVRVRRRLRPRRTRPRVGQ